jgi:small subunit ribosomal protein S4
MARYTGPVCRLCRREGDKLLLKGAKCVSGKCALERRNSTPGQHGAGNKKPKEYGIQLREKQKTKRYYGMLEKQFRNNFAKAEKMPGATGENLLSLLERRLDNAVYRMGLAESRRESRQIVLHEHIRVNGHKVNIPSFLVKTGDIITVSERSRSSERMKYLIDGLPQTITPKWMDVDKENAVATVIALPTKEDIDFAIEESLIVELYSK